MLKTAAKQVIIYRTIPAIHQFANGLKSMKLFDFCKQNLTVMLPLLQFITKEFHVSNFRELIEIKFSEQGSNYREEKCILYCEEYLV